MTLRNLNLHGFVLIRDNLSCHGEVLAFALLRSKRTILILTIPGREIVLRRRYGEICDRVSFIPVDNAAPLESLVSKTLSFKASACLLDCVDVLVDNYGVDIVVSFIFQLKGILPVIAVCSESSVNEEEFSRFRSVADIVLRIFRQDGNCVAESTIFRQSGKPTNLRETFIINTDFTISSEKIVPHAPSATCPSSIGDATRSLDMEFKLTEKELATKSKLGLPFTSPNKVVDLINLRMADRKVRVGGQIIYTPDKEDDLDDSDPDDDLNL